MTTLTDADLTRLTALAEAASGGRWRVSDKRDIWADEPSGAGTIEFVGTLWGEDGEANAAFIAAARYAVPKLVAEVRALREAIATCGRRAVLMEVAQHLELEAERAASMTQVAPASVSFALKDQALHFRAQARAAVEALQSVWALKDEAEQAEEQWDTQRQANAAAPDWARWYNGKAEGLRKAYQLVWAALEAHKPGCLAAPSKEGECK